MICIYSNCIEPDPDPYTQAFYVYARVLCIRVRSMYTRALYLYMRVRCIRARSKYTRAFYVYARVLCIRMRSMYMHAFYMYAQLALKVGWNFNHCKLRRKKQVPETKPCS